MSSEECRNKIDDVILIESLHSAKLLELILWIKSVSALGLNCGDSDRDHLIEGLSGLGIKLILCGFSRSFDCGVYSTTHSENVKIAGSVKLESELVLSPSTKYEMGMGVDQTRCDELSFSVDDFIEIAGRSCAFTTGESAAVSIK